MQYEIVLDFARKPKKVIKKMQQREKILDYIYKEVALIVDKGSRQRDVKRIDFPPELGYESTLYLLLFRHRIFILLTIDEDPIYEQVLVKVMSIGGGPSSARKEINRIRESLRQQIITGIDDEEIDLDEEEGDG